LQEGAAAWTPSPRFFCIIYFLTRHTDDETRRDGEALGFDLIHFPASFFFSTPQRSFLSFSLVWRTGFCWLVAFDWGGRLVLIKSFGYFFFLRARLAGRLYLFFFLFLFDEKGKSCTYRFDWKKGEKRMGWGLAGGKGRGRYSGSMK
jgi:hypothetical protein